MISLSSTCIYIPCIDMFNPASISTNVLPLYTHVYTSAGQQYPIMNVLHKTKIITQKQTWGQL